MDLGAPCSTRSCMLSIEISDIRITGIESSSLEPNPKCYLAITSHDARVQTRSVRGSTPRWVETLRFSVPNSSHIMISLMRKRRVGSVVRFGGYQISAQELFDQDLESSEIDIGPVPLTRLPTCRNPSGSIAFRISYERTPTRPTGLVTSCSGINQMQNDVCRLATSSSALGTSASTASGIVPSAESSTSALVLTSSLLRTSTALDKFVQAVSAISEIHPIAKLAMSLVTSAYDAWKAQTIRDARVAELATTVADLWEFMTQDECLERVESLKKTAAGMLSQTSECARFIREYTLDTRQVVRLAKNTLSDQDAIISSFQESFGKLKDNFRARINVKVVIVVLDMQQKLSDIQTTLGSIASDVSKLQAPNPVPPLTSVPTSILARAAPQIFHGRDDFVGDIVQTILHSDQARVPILGPGGMGKTSVALTVANDLSIVKRFGDRRHFVPCEEVTNPAPLVELIALHLGISLPSSSPWQHLLDSLRSIHSHCLLILDNFETPWDPHKTRTQTEQMVADLSCMPLLSLVVTMRGRVPPAGVKWSHPSSPLHPLSVGAAKATFLDIWSLEDLKLDELLQALDFFPLAITLVASVGQSSQLSPSELLESWKKEQTKLLNLGPTDRLNSVDYSINLSLQSTAMQQTPDALQLLSIIAMPPGGVVLRTLPSLAPNIANLDHAIRTLLSVSLAYKETSGTLRLLSPIRSYISQHHIPDSISLESLRKFYFNLANQCECDPGHKDFLGIRDEVALEESNIESVLLHFLSEHGDEAAVLAVAHYSWYLYWHHPRSEALGAAINVARQRRFTELLPQCLRRLGNILYVVNDYIRAIAAFEEAQTLCRLRRNRLEAAYCLESLGNILRMQSRDEEACAKLEEARDEFEAIGNQLGAAQCLQSLGKTLRMQERYGEARTALEDALERFQEIGHPLGAAECLRSIGRLHYSEHQYDDARTIIEDARTQFQAIGSTLGATQCLQYLGEILLEQGRYGEAHISLENAREQYQVIGERLGAAQCLKGVGDILRRETRYNEAHSCLEEAQYQFRAIGDRLGIANSVRCIGEIFIALDRHVEARKALDDARGIYQEVGQLRRAKFCDQLLSSICDRSP